MRSRDKFRRGYLLVAVLAVLLTVSTILLSMLPHLLRVRREGRFDATKLQTEMLARAGVLRAIEQLKVDPNYLGEVWRVPISPETNDLGSIQIEISSNPQGGQDIAIVARLLPGGIEQIPSAFEHPVQYEIKLPFMQPTKETLPSQPEA
ncbi:MAG: hypothetical protein ACK56W_16660 [Pirellula sp.]|nr:hypothetical protein [Pirellula sp.]